jgi:hypothetical protein
MFHDQVACPAPDKRRIYAMSWGGTDSAQTFGWACPVCGFRAGGSDEQDVRRLALAHSCSAGWCPIPAKARV